MEDKKETPQRRYALRHPDRVKKQRAQSRVKLKKADPNYWKRWYAKNKERATLNAARSHLRKNYNLTIEQYEAILKSQGGACAICNTTNPGRSTRTDGPRRYFCVDHNHATGKVRGLLCHHCNTALGHLRETPALFLAALEYLKR